MTTVNLDDGLTDEERAAMLSDDDGLKVGEVPAPATEDTPELPTAAVGEVPAPATEDTPELPADTDVKQPILVVTPDDDVPAKLAAIEVNKEKLLTQFDDGEITAREYQKALDTLSKEERIIERNQDRIELASQMEHQRMQNEWNSACAAFMDKHTIYKDNPRLYKVLDAEVKELAGKQGTSGWSGQKFLDEAHKAIKEAFNLPGDTQTTPQKPQRQPLPPNLAKVPSADVEDTNGGRFAVLDRMSTSDPTGYEETLAKMSDADRNAYLAA